MWVIMKLNGQTVAGMPVGKRGTRARLLWFRQVGHIRADRRLNAARTQGDQLLAERFSSTLRALRAMVDELRDGQRRFSIADREMYLSPWELYLGYPLLQMNVFSIGEDNRMTSGLKCGLNYGDVVQLEPVEEAPQTVSEVRALRTRPVLGDGIRSRISVSWHNGESARDWSWAGGEGKFLARLAATPSRDLSARRWPEAILLMRGALDGARIEENVTGAGHGPWRFQAAITGERVINR
jgi:hypothetical protein